MKGWQYVPIGSLVDDVQTWNPTRAEPTATFRYVDLSSVDQAEKRIADARTITAKEAPSRARQLVKQNDVLVSTVRPNLNGVAVVPPDLDGATASTGFCVLRGNDEALAWNYLFHWVKSPNFVASMVREATGQSYPAVSDNIVCMSKIPLPPLAEQRRIAAVLDAAEALRAKRRAALAQLDQLTQAIFLDMFGDPVRNTKKWPDSTVGEQLTFQLYGPRFYNETYTPDGVPIVRITDLDAFGTLNFSNMPRLAVDPADLEKYALQSGDIIFARTGATVGKVALMRPTDPVCIAGAYFITMRFVAAIHPEYARAVLTTKSVQEIVWIRSQQSAQQNFSGPGLRALPMPVPPIALQQRFAERLQHLREIQVTHRASLAALDTLFASLQHRAFRGEL